MNIRSTAHSFFAETPVSGKAVLSQIKSVEKNNGKLLLSNMPTQQPRSRRWVFTVNNYSNDEYNSLVSAGERLHEERISYLVLGRERGEGGTPHIQGAILFTNPMSLTGVRRLSPRAHWEPARGTPQQMADYCKKTPDYREWGSLPSQGKRNDLEAVKSQLHKGASFQEIATETTSFQAFRFAQLAAPYFSKPRNFKSRVTWFYGPPGTGKSRRAVHMAELDGTYYSHPGSKWWCGYDAQRTLIMDDLRPNDMPFNFLLKLFDRYSLTIEFKGGSTQFVSPFIIVTSALHWSSFVPPGENPYQLERRIEVTEEMADEWIPPAPEEEKEESIPMEEDFLLSDL